MRKSVRRALPLAALIALVVMALASPVFAGNSPVTGAAFTTTSDGSAVNGNIYPGKDAVYLNGGPHNEKAAGLSPLGYWYFQVTDPWHNDSLLSSDPITCRVVVVQADAAGNGRVVGVPATSLALSATTGNIYALADPSALPAGDTLIGNASCYHTPGSLDVNGGLPVQLIPYADTANQGGEYKAWLTPVLDYGESCKGGASGFCDADSQTDNFKIKSSTIKPAFLTVCKFQDLDLDGIWGNTDPAIQNWQFNLAGTQVLPGTQQFTDANGCTQFSFTNFDSDNSSGTLTLSEETIIPNPVIPPFVLQFAPDPLVAANSDPTVAARAECQNLTASNYFACAFGVVTAPGAPIVEGSIQFAGSAWVQLTLSPGDNVQAPAFGNQCFSDSGFPGFTSCAHMPVAKTAKPEIDYSWTITKKASPAEQDSNSASFSPTFNYVVTVAPHEAGWKLNGTITVDNFTGADLSGKVSVTDDPGVAGATCTIAGQPSPYTIPSFVNNTVAKLSYICTFASNPGKGTNTATASFTTPALRTVTSVGTADYDFSDPYTTVDTSVTVTDSIAGTLGTVTLNADGSLTTTPVPPVTSANPGEFDYTHQFTNVPPGTCTSYPNIATFTTNDTSTTGQANASVKVCITPLKTGALTMGFWQNKNGQGIITSQNTSKTAVCASGTWLRQFTPFQDMNSTANCSAVATYVYNVIKSASCTSTSKTCNSMLKAQMLATALDVYFSDSSLGGNRIGAYNGLGSAQQPIGGITIDLTHICQMIDSGGTGTCSGTYENVSSAFGGATSGTVSFLLQYAGSQSDTGGLLWYGNVKATQVLAKDPFDAINNQVVFTP